MQTGTYQIAESRQGKPRYVGWAVVLAALWALAPVTVAAQTRNVLVVYSDDRLLPANIRADRAIRETIIGSAEHPVEIFSEFLDWTHFSGEGYERLMADFFHQKYAARSPDAIIACGFNALALVLQNRTGPFSDVPIVFVGVSRTWLQLLEPLPADVVGVPVEYDYAGTIDQALRFHPNASRLVIVTGSSKGDRDDEARLRNETRRLIRPVSAEFLAGMATTAVAQRVAALGSDAVVFTPGYFTDGDGRNFSPRESAQIIAAASTAPVYGPFNTFLGTGVVGGRMPNFEEMGRVAATIVNRLFDGAAPQSLSLPAMTPTPLQIDWRQARRWGIEHQVPKDAIVHFREPTLWEAYGRVALLGLLVILVQAGLIAGLLYERRLRQRTAAALAASERRMILAARTARLSSWAWSTAPHQDQMNGTARERRPTLRTPVSVEPTAVDFADVLTATHPADREALARAVHRASANDEEVNVEYRVMGPNQVRWFVARGRGESGNPALLRGVALDITQRKLAEIQAEQDRTALRHMTRVSLLGQLSASIAHQLNQPLAAILGNAEAAQKMLSRDDVDLEELKEICDDIVTEDNRAAQVIRRLGALYKHGERELHPVDINELIRETLELLRTDLVTRQVTPKTELAPNLQRIVGERVQLQQVFLNLIVNAADAMSDVEERARALTIRTEAVGDDVCITVSDCGRGIAITDLEHIFDPFWTSKPGGMGIGLAICRSITTAHGGSLMAANTVEGGATFSVTLPAASAAR